MRESMPLRLVQKQPISNKFLICKPKTQAVRTNFTVSALAQPVPDAVTEMLQFWLLATANPLASSTHLALPWVWSTTTVFTTVELLVIV